MDTSSESSDASSEYMVVSSDMDDPVPQDIQYPESSNGTERIIKLMTADGDSLDVTEAETLQLHIAKDAIENDSKGNPTYTLPGITKNVMSLVMKYCMDNNTEFVKEVDPPTLLDLIEAAHHFQITGLMDSTCQTLVSKIRTRDVTAIKNSFFTGLEHNKESEGKLIKWVLSYRKRMIRVRGKQTLMKPLNFVESDRSPFVRGSLDFIKRRDKVFNDSVSKLLQFNKLKDPLIATWSLESSTKDPELAARMEPDVIRHFFNFLKKHNQGGQKFVSRDKERELEDLQCSVLKILSRVRYYPHRDLTKGTEVIPTLMDLASDPTKLYSFWAVATLTNIAYASPKQFKNFLDKALGLVENFIKIYDGTGHIGPVAKFMAALCRNHHLQLHMNDAALNILQSILQMNWTTAQQPIEQACYALQYLTYDGRMKIGGEALNKLVGWLIMIMGQHMETGDPSFPGYALGVVGNIARCATNEESKILISNFRLLEFLRNVILFRNSMKILKEACQIIANLAARGRLLEAMHTANLIEPLCSLLEKDGSDVKTEAAWAIFNGIYGSIYVH